MKIVARYGSWDSQVEKLVHDNLKIVEAFNMCANFNKAHPEPNPWIWTIVDDDYKVKDLEERTFGG